MNSTRFVWTGLEELKQQLRTLPADLAGEASHIVEGAANGAAADLKAVYAQHVVTRHLLDSVIVTHYDKGRFGAGALVKVTDHIAWLFDNGSQARHWVSGKSTGTMWGRTAPTHVFVKTLIAARRRMWTGLKDLLERHGLLVTGDVG